MGPQSVDRESEGYFAVPCVRMDEVGITVMGHTDRQCPTCRSPLVTLAASAQTDRACGVR